MFKGWQFWARYRLLFFKSSLKTASKTPPAKKTAPLKPPLDGAFFVFGGGGRFWRRGFRGRKEAKNRHHLKLTPKNRPNIKLFIDSPNPNFYLVQ